MNREMENLKKENQDQRLAITEMGKKLQTAEKKIRSAENRLSASEMYGIWCASRFKWNSGDAQITFDKNLLKHSNIRSNAINTGTGENKYLKKGS